MGISEIPNKYMLLVGWRLTLKRTFRSQIKIEQGENTSALGEKNISYQGKVGVEWKAEGPEVG